MTSPPPRILYVLWRRARWSPLLARSTRLDVVECEGDSTSLAAAIRRHSPDLLLVESLGRAALAARVARRLAGTPLVARLKGDLWREADDPGVPGASRLRRLAVAALAERLLDRADRVLPIAPHLADEARRRLPSGAVGTVLGNPALARVAPVGDGVAPELLTVTNFAFAAKVAPLEAAAIALAPLLAKRELTWTILGDGVHLPEWRARLARISSRISLPGPAPAMERLAGRPLVLAITGLDGLPNVLLEAAACGCAVVTNAGSPVAPLLPDGDAVLDFAAPREAADRLEALVLDAGRRRRSGETLQSRIEERFDPDRLRRDIEEELLGFLGGGRAGVAAPDGV